MNNATKLNKSEHSLFLIVKTEVISIVLLHWPSIYIQQHNKEPSTCRTSGRGLAHLGSSDEPHGSMSPSLFWHWLPAERCQLLGDPFSVTHQPRAVLRTVVWCRWGWLCPCAAGSAAGWSHGKPHGVSAVYQNEAYFNQKAWKPSEASLSMVIMCVFDARTGVLSGLVPSSGSGEEQDYC